MPWSLVVVVVATCSAVLSTLWLALLLLDRAFTSITQMCTAVVRTLLGQPDPDSDQIQFEDEIGSSSGLFDTLPAWQYWGRDAEGEALEPQEPFLPVEDDEGVEK
jgi:hypothetical protein